MRSIIQRRHLKSGLHINMIATEITEAAFNRFRAAVTLRNLINVQGLNEHLASKFKFLTTINAPLAKDSIITHINAHLGDKLQCREFKATKVFFYP